MLQDRFVVDRHPLQPAAYCCSLYQYIVVFVVREDVTAVASAESIVVYLYLEVDADSRFAELAKLSCY
ncbi:MAG: hypothetical protein J7641_21925 [Cyanobacteria bacterium SID2]|nr:hypothetical protein [Cyanobacteria bacterium SID2]MBP0004798.1 hypothetical protein [Cyanobacteria bacterium SBC]